MSETISETNSEKITGPPHAIPTPISHLSGKWSRPIRQQRTYKKRLDVPVPQSSNMPGIPMRRSHIKGHPPKPLLAAVILTLFLSACGDDDTDDPADTSTSASTTTIADTSTTTEAPGIQQPAIWPAAGVLFATPEAAAEDFVRTVLGLPLILGEFQQGDSRSGEMEVFWPGEDGTSRIPRGLLLLRQLGPDNGWFILGVMNDKAAITSPESSAKVPPGPLQIEGVGQGFEGTVYVTAFIAGDIKAQLDRVTVQVEAYKEASPFTTALDLSAASPGDIVTLLVRGDTGPETDSGQFGAIPVLVTSDSE